VAFQLKFRNEEVVVDYKFFLFKEFTDIWNIKDKKLDKNKLLKFVFLFCDLTEENPIKNVKADKLEEEAKFNAFNDRHKVFTKKELKLLDPAIKKYVYLNTTMEERLLYAFDRKAVQLSAVIENVIPETVTNKENGVVSFVSNSKIITDALSKFTKLRVNREKILASIRNEAISQKVRGSIKLSPLIRGLIKL
jgi:hypothetical protein